MHNSNSSLLLAVIKENLNLQSWSQNGRRRCWIIKAVEQPSVSDLCSATACSPRCRQRVAALCMEERQRIAGSGETTSSDLETNKMALTSNWICRTGWELTYRDTDLHLLSALSRQPVLNRQSLRLGKCKKRELYSSVDTEQQLALIAPGGNSFFDRCKNTARHTDNSTRCWLRSHVRGRPYKVPFELPGRERTRMTYRN